jgi:uncharacterized protein YacL (UPF0231 family)
MLSSNYNLLLGLYTQTQTIEERNDIEQQLRELEITGSVKTVDFIELLANTHPVIQLYAASALGRQKSEEGIRPLGKLYRKQKNPLILVQLLNIFTDYGSDRFLDAVMEKIVLAPWKGMFNKEVRLNHELLRDQLLVDSFKYIQRYGSAKIGRKIRPFIEHSDELVRWNALKAFDDLHLKLSKGKLQKMESDDPNRLVRELASIMMEKMALRNRT